MTVAIYARYSSDMQNDSSIEDQIDHDTARRLAKGEFSKTSLISFTEWINDDHYSPAISPVMSKLELLKSVRDFSVDGVPASGPYRIQIADFKRVVKTIGIEYWYQNYAKRLIPTAEIRNLIQDLDIS